MLSAVPLALALSLTPAPLPAQPATVSIAPTPCRPAPFEDCGEGTFDQSPSRYWGMDDNRYCPEGPPLDCYIPNTGENPNQGFQNGTGCIFEMYVVADCGTVMHVPLCDVESGTLRVKDPLGGDVYIHAANELVTGRDCTPGTPAEPMDEAGFEIEWRATSCSPPDMTTTGGPGNYTLIDVWFTGDDDTLPGRSLCGVYTLQFESWAGCGWELFANCDGTNSPEFLIYDDLCAAQDSVTPLPELVLEDLRASPASDPCTVAYCVDVTNVGCVDPLQFEVVVREEVSGNTDVQVVDGLGSGETVEVCGTVPVDSLEQTVTVPVRADVDLPNDVVECTEVPQASSCDPASGEDTLRGSTVVECNRPPECDADGPYVVECAGSITPVDLDGSGSTDPDGDPLTYRWATDCPGALRDDDMVRVVLDFDSSGLGCARSCVATLTVSDGWFDVSCTSDVTVQDTTPPAFRRVPADLTVECSETGGAPASHPDIQAWRDSFDGGDVCSDVTEEDDMPSFFPAGCAPGRETPVSVTLTDACGLQAEETRSVSVQDTTPPPFTRVPDDLTVECSQRGGTPADNPGIEAWRDSFEAEDVCGAVTDRDDMPPFFPAGCEPGRETPVTVTAVDWCRLETDATRSVFVQDTTPPFFTNVPDDLTVECSETGGAPADHPEIVAWRAEFQGDDVCFGVTDSDDMPPFFPAGCAPGQETPVTVTLTDECRLQDDETRSVWVQDTIPPEILGIDFDGSCLWPPNHKYVCFDDVQSRVRMSDICDPDPQARVAGCSSNQPDDARDDLFPGANGDGHTFNDCTIGAGGQSVCMRSERLGTDPGGRYYTPVVEASDECTNASQETASVYVPHDQSPHEKDCVHPDSPGTR